MSNIIDYTNAPADINSALGNAIVIDDFLPSPAELISKTEKEKITIAIDKNSLRLFRQYAKTHNAKYQAMINGALGSYAEKFLSHK